MSYGGPATGVLSFNDDLVLLVSVYLNGSDGGHYDAAAFSVSPTSTGPEKGDFVSHVRSCSDLSIEVEHELVPRAKVQLSLSVSVHEYSRRLLFLAHGRPP